MHISEAISKLKFAYYLFLSEHGITRKTQIFLYSFSVKSVPERNHQVYFSICIIPDSKFVHQPITGFPSCNLFNRNNASI